MTADIEMLLEDADVTEVCPEFMSRPDIESLWATCDVEYDSLEEFSDLLRKYILDHVEDVDKELLVYLKRYVDIGVLESTDPLERWSYVERWFELATGFPLK